MNQTEKFNFVEQMYEGLHQSQEVLSALCSQFYAPYLILLLTERDTFMKTTDFTVYNKALENTSQFELEIIANSS